MKLCSIISAWGDTLELLPFCIDNHLKFCNAVIVVWSERSNHGVRDPRMKEFVMHHTCSNVIFQQLEPIPRRLHAVNERRKRNAGIDAARLHEFTHFMIADADEFYDPAQVEIEKLKFERPIHGLVCGLKVYVRHPTLRTSDHTLVPFIHTLTDKIKCSENHHYPFSVDRNGPHIDPTRRFNIANGVYWSDIVMHHMSYVRKDISMKINNSTANLRGNRATIEEDMRSAGPGWKSRIYNTVLEECENIFNLPSW